MLAYLLPAIWRMRTPNVAALPRQRDRNCQIARSDEHTKSG
jgi:hypothetical protein